MGGLESLTWICDMLDCAMVAILVIRSLSDCLSYYDLNFALMLPIGFHWYTSNIIGVLCEEFQAGKCKLESAKFPKT